MNKKKTNNFIRSWSIIFVCHTQRQTPSFPSINYKLSSSVQAKCNTNHNTQHSGNWMNLNLEKSYFVEHNREHYRILSTTLQSSYTANTHLFASTPSQKSWSVPRPASSPATIELSTQISPSTRSKGCIVQPKHMLTEVNGNETAKGSKKVNEMVSESVNNVFFVNSCPCSDFDCVGALNNNATRYSISLSHHIFRF